MQLPHCCCCRALLCCSWVVSPRAWPELWKYLRIFAETRLLCIHTCHTAPAGFLLFFSAEENAQLSLTCIRANPISAGKFLIIFACQLVYFQPSILRLSLMNLFSKIRRFFFLPMLFLWSKSHLVKSGWGFSWIVGSRQVIGQFWSCMGWLMWSLLSFWGKNA